MLVICKPLGFDGLHPGVLRKLPDAIVRSLFIIFEWSWHLGEVPEDWKRTNITIFEKGKKEDLWNYRLDNLTSVTGKVMQKSLLDTISTHMEAKKVARSHQQGFKRGNHTWPTRQPLRLGDQLGGQGRAVDAVYHDFSKVFDTVTCDIIIEKLAKYKCI